MNEHPIPLPWSISLFLQGMCSVGPQRASVKDGEGLTRLFLEPPWKHLDFPKKQLPCWSPALYPPNKTRKNANVEAITALVFDYDSPTWSPARLHSQMVEKQVAHVIHTTWSHRAEAPRYRLILFTDRAIKPKEFLRVRENALALVEYREGVDDLRDLARHYALPMRRTGSPFEGYVEIDLPALKVDSLTAAPTPTESEPVLTKETEVQLDGPDGGEKLTIAEIGELGEGKYKCACPFQHDASPGSAFVRVCKGGRILLCCTSSRHAHKESTFWLQSVSKKKRPSRHSLERRRELLAEVPDDEMSFIENHIAYSLIQTCFYVWTEGSWAVGSPMKKEGVKNILIGRLAGGLDGSHVDAIIDHLLARPVFGLGCDSSGGRVVLDNGRRKLNLYQKPTLVPREGKWDRIKEIVRVLCGGDPEAMKWLIHWSASIIQRPERRSMVAVLALSPQQGIGKSLFGRILAEIIGKGNSVVVSNRALRDSFNASYVTRLLVLADEVGIDRGAQDVISELKAYISDDRVHCMTPYAARTEITNRMTWWLTSNNRRPMLVEKDDRRLSILSAGKASPEYRQMLKRCFQPDLGIFTPAFQAEVCAFAKALHSVAVDYDLISRPHESAARKELQDASQSSVEGYLSDLQETGLAQMMTAYPPNTNYLRLSESALQRATPCETLYGSYLSWCERMGRKDAVSEAIFRLGVRALEGVRVKTLMRAGTRVKVYQGVGAPDKTPTPEGALISLPRME